MRQFKLTINVAKRSRFDIFGFFESVPNLSTEDQKNLALKTASEWVSVNSLKLGIPNSSFKLKDWSMVGGKLIINLTVGA